MTEENCLQVDLERVIRDKNPSLARRPPRPLLSYLKRTIHQDEINRILKSDPHLDPIGFIRATLADMRIGYRSQGLDRLPADGRYLFVSNHPFGGMDGMGRLCAELSTRFSEVRIIVNDLLMNLRPLAPLFVPVNKHGRQNARHAQTLRGTLEEQWRRTRDVPGRSPLEKTSRTGSRSALEAQFRLKNALESRRDIVPVRFDGELSSFFYNLSNLRSALGIRANIEMLYLPDEMFRQKGRRFEIRFGEPVRWQSLRDAPARSLGRTDTRHGIRAGERIVKNPWRPADFGIVFINLPQIETLGMKPVIDPVAADLIENELTPERLLRRTNNGGNEIYVMRAQECPNLMREIGRLRELSFRDGGGGTGADVDIDELDLDRKGTSSFSSGTPRRRKSSGATATSSRGARTPNASRPSITSASPSGSATSTCPTRSSSDARSCSPTIRGLGPIRRDFSRSTTCGTGSARWW